MKTHWLLAASLALTAPALTLAAEETNSITTPDRVALTLGDSVQEMQTRMRASPIKVNSYELPATEKPNTLAVDYTYEIENMQYIITIVNNYVYKIKKENLDK
ncbi:hypothetical protein [Acinetobacter tianfuensis]|uniref:DUF1236 domain-containing protein n=1 Tax=Acinetobacter tianfuensis TaxID=2419603 RepID=A0A3A8EWR4_9GAMM|nr:hypothetical protein [Acinetobacter tianfuensis]RKG34504.1 hypothetical protein D7V32_00010 [Acinetobacter tianfuensis]